MADVKPIPDGYTTVTAHLTCKDTASAIDFYTRAFGAEELFRMPGPGGMVMHAEMKIGNSIIMLAEEFPMPGGGKAPKSLGGSCVCINLYVEDCDALFQRAVDAGATAVMPLADQFWGDRYGKLEDPQGHHWAVMTHKEDLTPEQIGERAAEAMKGMGDCG